MKENFQIHIWLGLLLCLLGMSCSDDTPAKGDDPGNGNTELEVNEWIESVMRSDYLWNNDIPAQNKLDFSADPIRDNPIPMIFVWKRKERQVT